MTIYSVILFLHVLGTLALFAAFVVEGLSLWYLRAAEDVEEVRRWAKISAGVMPLSVIAMPLIFLPGAYLARAGKVWSQGWLQVGLVATFLIVALATGITRPRTRALGRAAAEGSGNVSNVLQSRLRDPFLRVSLQLRAALGFGVVFLMIAKPNHPNALLVLAVAIASGLVASAIHRSPKRVAVLTS
jgi:hypothetical protein